MGVGIESVKTARHSASEEKNSSVGHSVHDCLDFPIVCSRHAEWVPDGWIIGQDSPKAVLRSRTRLRRSIYNS